MFQDKMLLFIHYDIKIDNLQGVKTGYNFANNNI
jgi:hypothetical protein